MILDLSFINLTFILKSEKFKDKIDKLNQLIKIGL